MLNIWKKGALICAALPISLLMAGCSTYSAGMGEKGVAEVKRGNWQAAREDFNSDFNRNPGHPIAVFNMGDTYHHDGNIQLADAKFSDAVTIGKQYRPDEFLEPNSRSATIAEISCRHLHEDSKLNADCGDQIAVLVPPAPPAQVAEAQPAPAVEAQATTVPKPKQDRN
jgi:hypothetical protein